MAVRSLDHMDYYVYIFFRWNGLPFYVGKGRGRRINNHEWYARSGRGTHCANVIRDMLNDGHRDIPRLKIAEGLSSIKAVEYEIAWIAAIGRKTNGGLLVNLTDGGDNPSGYIPSAETRAKNGAAHRGRKCSPQARANMSAGMMGRIIHPQHLAKMNAARLGVPVTDETKAKLSTSLLGNTNKLGHRDTPETLEKKRRARMPQHRLSDEKASEIRAGHKTFPEKTTVIAERYGVSEDAIKSVLKGKTWKLRLV
jgi:hypothetical protein